MTNIKNNWQYDSEKMAYTIRLANGLSSELEVCTSTESFILDIIDRKQKTKIAVYYNHPYSDVDPQEVIIYGDHACLEGLLDELMSGLGLDRRSATQLRIIKEALASGNFASRDIDLVSVDKSFFRN